MFNREKTIQQLKKLSNSSPFRVVPATVLSVEDGSCTVQPFGSDLILSGVKPFVSGTEERKVIVTPCMGSVVLIGTPGEKIDPANLYVFWVSKPDALVLVVGKYAIESTNTNTSIMGPSGKINPTSTTLQTLFSH